MSNALTTSERSRLYAAEDRIEHNLKAWRIVADSLLLIRDDKLYKATHSGFAAYCRERWGFGKSHAYRLIEAALYMQECPPTGDTSPPANERQARLQIAEDKELAAMTPEEQAEAIGQEENRVLEEGARVRDNEGRRDRLNQGERLLKRARAVYRGLGPEGEEVTDAIDTALEVADRLPRAA